MMSAVGGSAFKLGRRPALDGVRAIAVLAVLAFHFRANQSAIGTRGGFLGVDIFFVLSGFLITALLYEERAGSGRIRISAFYKRRALRLFPALIVLVAAYAAWAALTRTHESGGNIVAVLFYFNNWWMVAGHDAAGLGHTWSLSIEEQFYILWPALLLILFRLGGAKCAIRFCVAGLVAAPILRTFVWHGAASEPRIYFALDTRSDALLAGCLLALLLETGRIARYARALRGGGALAVSAVAAFLLAAPQLAEWMNTIGFSIFAVSVAIVIYNIVERDMLAWLLHWRPMLWIGRRSYGIYLWHFPILFALLHALHKMHRVDPIAVPLTFIAAAVSFRYVESPFLRLKERRSVHVTVPAAPLAVLVSPGVTERRVADSRT